MDLELASNVLGDDQDLGLAWEHKSCSGNTNVVLGTQRQILVLEHKHNDMQVLENKYNDQNLGLFQKTEKKTVSELRLVPEQEDQDQDLGIFWEHKQKYWSGNTNTKLGRGTKIRITWFGDTNTDISVWGKHKGWSGNKDQVQVTKTTIRIWGCFRIQNTMALKLKDEEQDLRTITQRLRNNPSKEQLKLDLITDVLKLPWSRNDSRCRRCSSEITFEEDKSDKKVSKDY